MEGRPLPKDDPRAFQELLSMLLPGVLASSLRLTLLPHH
jgi:hypothetical protein